MKPHPEDLAELAETKDSRYRVIFNSLVDHALIVFNSKGMIEDFNPGAGRLFGYSEEEARGLNVSLLIPQQFINEHEETTNNDPLTGQNRNVDTGGEVLCHHKDGSIFQAHLSISESLVAGEKISCAIIRDISREKSLAVELEDTLLKVDQAANAKSEFLANMSHELRTPLNGVMGMLELIKGTSLDAQQDNYVTTAYRSANALLKVISSILDYSKLESDTLNIQNIVFNVREIIEGSITLAATDIAEKGLEFNCLITEEVPRSLCGDAAHLRQIIVCLISNSIKFTEKGKINLRVSVAEINEAKVRIQVELEDTGIGIAESKLDSVFEPFTQKDNSSTRKYGGAGLGLSVAKRLINLMNGEIGVKSKEGQGATFWFSLWFDLQQLTAATPMIVTDSEQRFGRRSKDLQFANKNILIVDDTEINLRVGKEMLRKLGLQSDLVSSGTAALEAIATKQYDLVLMDCQMPGMDGYTATREIRILEIATGQDKHLPVVAVTAHALEGDRETCLEAGMDDYLSKPFALSELESILDRWLPKSTEA